MRALLALCKSDDEPDFAEGWFLRLNSRPHWRPNFELLKRENPCLENDCYIEVHSGFTVVSEFDQ